MIDRDLLRTENGVVADICAAREFAVPDTVQAVVAARIDLLGPAEKQALQAASVIGRVFWAGPVYELVHDAGPTCDVLEERDFIRRRPGSSLPGDREYAIKHALTREVAYASLPRARRARLHAAFARWLERRRRRRRARAAPRPPLRGGGASEDVDLAWAGAEDELAELRARARHGYSGRQSLRSADSRLTRASRCFTARSNWSRGNDERVTLWRAIGRANVLKLDGEAFWTAMLNSLEGSDRKTAADTYSELGFQTSTRASMWKRRPDVELIHEWIDRALELAEAESPARAKALIARARGVTTRTRPRARRASSLTGSDDPSCARGSGAHVLCSAHAETTTRRRSAGRSTRSSSRRGSTTPTTSR